MKTAIFYYTQSGQALTVAQRICENMGQVVYKQIEPLEEFPFPWSRQEFFDTFPETRLGIPPFGIRHIDLSDVQDANLVIVAGQSWFLSPSLPLQSFFNDTEIKNYLAGRNIVFVNVCRNMWLMTAEKIKEYVADTGARLVGHIVLQDRHPNLISALTVVRWLIGGKKSGGGLLPDAGVSRNDIEDASRLGSIIVSSWQDGDLSDLQQRLIEAGAIDYKPSILFLEKTAHRMFGKWASFIRKKGGFRSPQRRWRVSLFYYYLLIALFILSPFAQLFFYLTYPIHKNTKQDI